MNVFVAINLLAEKTISSAQKHSIIHGYSKKVQSLFHYGNNEILHRGVTSVICVILILRTSLRGRCQIEVVKMRTFFNFSEKLKSFHYNKIDNND